MKIVTINNLNFEQEVLNSDIPVAVYFYSDDSIQCINFGQIFQRVSLDIDTIKFAKIFKTQNREIADKYNVKTTPTILFFKNGIETCSRLTGYIEYPEFKNAIQNILAEKCPINVKNIIKCDTLILGAGPAGLTAAIYSARSKLHTVVIESNMVGGQVATTFHIANYPGTNGVVRGLDLMENMKKQALDFGTQIDDLQTIESVKISDDQVFIKTPNNEYYSKSLIIATGAEPRKLPIPEEKEFRSKGIHYCAACDGALYQDANIAVVGGGISATEEALFLTRYAKSILLINKNSELKAPKSVISEIDKSSQIKVLNNTIIKSVKGEMFVESMEILNTKTNTLEQIPIEGIFVYIGNIPNTSLFKEYIELNEFGYIKTNDKLMTSKDGIFAAGDVREKEIRQITTAVSDGTIAGIMAEKYISTR